MSLGRKCDPLRAFSTKAQEMHEMDAGILAGIISTVSILLLVILIVLICRWVGLRLPACELDTITTCALKCLIIIFVVAGSGFVKSIA